MRNPLTLEAFAEWAEKQPADKTYCFMSPAACACTQYAESIGIMNYQTVCGDPSGSFWERAEWAACGTGMQWTFGALAARLRASPPVPVMGEKL